MWGGVHAASTPGNKMIVVVVVVVVVVECCCFLIIIIVGVPQPRHSRLAYVECILFSFSSVSPT